MRKFARYAALGHRSDPGSGRTDERQDTIGAYTDALALRFARDGGYAKKAIEIMDAWSATITDHTDSTIDAPLTAAATARRLGGAGSAGAGSAERVQRVRARRRRGNPLGFPPRCLRRSFGRGHSPS